MLRKIIMIFNAVAIIIIGLSVLHDLGLLKINPEGISNITINSYDADINLTNEGTMEVSETWMMNYEGDYTVRFRDIEYEKFPLNYPLPYSIDNQASFDTVDYYYTIDNRDDNYLIFSKGTSFTNENDERGEKISCPDDSAERCESFFIHNRIFDFSEDTTFLYEYNIKNVVTEYSDVQEYNWVLFSYAESTVLDGRVIISLPNVVANTEDIEVYTSSIKNADVLIEQDRITIDFTKLYTDQELAFRILVPTTTFTNLNASSIFIDEGINKTIIMDYEEELIGDPTVINFTNLYICISSLFLANLLFIIGNYKFKQYLSPYQININKDYYKSPPSDHSPAIIGFIINDKKFSRLDLVSATLLDLIYKEYLIVDDSKVFDERTNVYKMYMKEELDSIKNRGRNDMSLRTANLVIYLNEDKDLDELNSYEKYLIDWYINMIGNESSVSINQLNEYVNSTENSQSFLHKSSLFRLKVRTEANKINIVDEHLNEGKSRVYSTLLFSIIAIAIQVVLSIQYDRILFIPYFLLLVASILFYVFVNKTTRKSEQWEKLVLEWTYYRENLKEMKVLTTAEVLDVEYFDYHLIYATLFHIADKVLNNLSTNVNQSEPDMNPVMNNYIYYRMYHRTLHNGYRKNRIRATRVVKKYNASMSSSSSSHSGGSHGGGGGGGRSR